MKRGDIVSYTEWSSVEGANYQRRMNFNIPCKNYAIILMSVRPNAPYADRFEDEGTTIIYEGHDVQKNYNSTELLGKEIDQPMRIPNGELSENGKFFEAARSFINGDSLPKIIKVYEKIKSGIWSYNGYFHLVDAWIE